MILGPSCPILVRSRCPKNYRPSCLGPRFCWAEWSGPSCLWAELSVIRPGSEALPSNTTFCERSESNELTSTVARPDVMTRLVVVEILI